MTFEEFFRKKRIDLAALQLAEPALFSEFQTHFEQMGEKSFDHTKKYWFNKLRLQYHLLPEVKEEKVIIENRLAEQTIIESLEEPAPQPTVGFKPRFKPGMTKPAELAPEPQAESSAAEIGKPAESTLPPSNVGFKPRFKAGVTKVAEPQPEVPAPETEKPAEPTTQPPTSVGFKPRFKAGLTKIVDPAFEKKEESKVEPLPEPPTDEKPAEETLAKPGYKPRFNMKNMKPGGE